MWERSPAPESVRVRTGKRGRPPRICSPGLLLAQVVKTSAQRRVVAVSRRIVRGSPEAVTQVLATASGGQHQINTAYIERWRSGESPRGRYVVYCILSVLAVQSVKHSTQAKGVVISGFSWRRLIVVGALRSTLHLDAFGAYALSSAQGAVPRLAAHLEGAGDAGHAPPGTMEPDDCQTCLS